MSKSWYFRFGACLSSRPVCLDLAQLHGHVSLKGRQLYRHRSSAAQCRCLTSSRKLSGDREDPIVTSEPLQPSRGYLSAIPKVTTLVSQFEEAAITRWGGSKESDGGQGRPSIRSPKFFETTPIARDTHNARHGLGSWVITPDALKPHNATKAELTATGIGEATGANEDASAVEQSRTSRDDSSRAREHSLLALTLDYTRHLHSALAMPIAGDSNDLIELIKNVFSSERRKKLEQRGFQAEDVVCWGWILAADTADIAVNRMHIMASLATHGRDISSISDLPYFMFTIILRSRRLSESSLTLLVNVFSVRLQQRLASVSTLPDATTSMIMLARLVRHARRVAPGQLTAIADLSEILLRAEYEAKPSSAVVLQRLAYNYNRLLSWLSIATSQHPFRYVSIQQQAQFKIIRQMASMEPPLPVTREGYQALAKVQLAHKKTPAEQEWARTKAGSWPPWREDKLGISEDVEYPGSQSRAADVLRRQIEAGYMRTNWDKAATVLAGWDTDKSPTIQTRAVVPKAPLTWRQSLLESLAGVDGEKRLGSTQSVEVWTARIRATRTIREAWACFCAYDTASSSAGRVLGPYYAMFDKLAGRLQMTDPGFEHLPGDGREVHPQPISSRHYLYVPQEPPSFHAFYDKMRLDGVQPGGRLLALLLDHARTLREGIMYLEQSKYSEIKRDVMLNAHKYDAEFIRSTLKFVQPFMVASFLTMLWRTRKGSGKTWYRPTSHTAGASSESSKSVSRERISARAYVLDLVTRIQLPAQIGNKVLETIVRDLKTKTDLISLNGGWRALQTVLDSMVSSNTEPDMATFYTAASAIEHVYDANSDFRFRMHRASREECISYGCQLAKKLFVQAVVDSTSDILVPSEETSTSLSAQLELGPDSKTGYLQRINARVAATRTKWLPYSADAKILQVPSPAALHLLMRLLAKGGETRSILRLLRWMDRFAIELTTMRNEVANGDRQMRFALCVAAMAIEEDLGTSRPDLGEEVATVRKLIEDNKAWGGWPKDDELERYLLNGRPSDR